jgi:hypothetical protein
MASSPFAVAQGRPQHPPPLWREKPSVPFRGGGPGRLPKKERVKLTKAQKKALKWARKHPEPEQVPRSSVTWNPVSVFMETNAGYYMGTDYTARHYDTTGITVYDPTNGMVRHRAIQQALQPYLGQIYTPTTTVAMTNTATNAVQVFDNNYTITFNASSVTTTGTITVNACRQPTDWAAWQGQGHQSDLFYDPNDQVQQARIRRERRDEADYQQRRMEAAAAEAERRRQWEAGAEQRRIEAEQRRVQRETALACSYALLFQHLTDDQRNMLESENRFLIEVNSGRIYEIRRGRHQNVYRLDENGHAVEQLCCLPRGEVPDGDVMLAQMLHLLCNEEQFRRIANRWDLRDMQGNQLDRRLPLTDGARRLDRVA